MEPMLTLVVIFAVIVFGLAFFSPRLSKKVERKTTRQASHLKTRSNKLWSPLTFVAHGALEMFKRMTGWSAKRGRRVRRKTERDDNEA